MKTAKKHLDENNACTAVPVRKGTVPARCRKRYPFPYENQLILYLEHFHPKDKNGKQQQKMSTKQYEEGKTKNNWRQENDNDTKDTLKAQAVSWGNKVAFCWYN